MIAVFGRGSSPDGATVSAGLMARERSRRVHRGRWARRNHNGSCWGEREQVPRVGDPLELMLAMILEPET